MEKFEVEYRALHQKFRLSDFDLLLNPPKVEVVPEPVKISFTEFFRNQLCKETQLKKVTLTNQTNCLIKLTEFGELNYALLQDFEIFLKNEKNLKVNTIEKYHRQFREYINSAIRQELFPINKNPCKDYKLVTEETDTLQPTEVCTRLGWSRSTFEQFKRDGLFRTFKIGGKVYVYTSDLLALFPKDFHKK